MAALKITTDLSTINWNPNSGCTSGEVVCWAFNLQLCFFLSSGEIFAFCSYTVISESFNILIKIFSPFCLL